MGLYTLMVMNWSIFTLLWIQLIVCASIHTTNNSIQLCRSQQPQHNNNEANKSLESIIEMSSTSKESSLVIELNPSDEKSEQVCRQSFIAPPRHVFFIRLFRYSTSLTGAGADERQKLQWAHKQMMIPYSKPKYSCPLEISLYNDTITPPWRIDPCRQETMDMEETPRIQPGRLTFTWNHGGHAPAFKILLTVLGQGEPCYDANKFTCFGFSHVPILCISDELTCDGVEHCPLGPGMRSDEEPGMCVGQNLGPVTNDMNIWQHLSLNFLKNILGKGDAAGKPLTGPTSIHQQMMPPTPRPELMVPKQKTSLTKGISRYGPWGYLMLGMLVCGAALLMCGLWECCCKRHKPDNDDSSASVDNPSIFIEGQNRGPTASAPPNYEELDPPPAYAALFPAQKSIQSAASTESLPQAQVHRHLHDTGGTSRT